MLVAVCGGYLLIPVGQGGISQAACDRIKLGMSEEQVIELLGRARKTNRGYATIRWDDEDHNEIFVKFDETQHVSGKYFAATPLSLFELMSRRVRALWP